MANVSVDHRQDILGELFVLLSEQERSLSEVPSTEDESAYVLRAKRINDLLREIE